ncbi:MAG: hypothetical protein ACLPSH_22040 [Vulcanimicrobiaceae bacterium]
MLGAGVAAAVAACAGTDVGVPFGAGEAAAGLALDDVAGAAGDAAG